MQAAHLNPPPPPPPPPTSMTEEDHHAEKVEDNNLNLNLPIPNPPFLWFTKLISFEADIIHSCLVSLSSPFLSLLYLLSDSYHRAEETKETVESAVHAAGKVPSTVVHQTTQLLKKLGLGFVGAIYMSVVLMILMILAIGLGVGLVQLWVEEPVIFRERMDFDYSDAHPNAVLSFGNNGGFEGYYGKNKKMGGVPVGHTFHVSLVLLLPESDFNRDIGVFQLTGELISTNGHVIAKASHPCMLRFRSLPIRLMRTFLMVVPLILGITSETQKITIPMLSHKERYPRTEAIKITMIPRVGTLSLPQLYESEILIISHLPWSKELVHRWKWTFYVWTSIYAYMFLIIIVFCCFKPLVFPTLPSRFKERETTREVSEEQKPRVREGREREISESLRRWQQSRRKRKAVLLHGHSPETTFGGGSSASSMSVTREDASIFTRDDASTVVEEDTGDSESVCFGGLS